MADVLKSEFFLSAPARRGALYVALVGSVLFHALVIYVSPPLGQASLPTVVYTEVELLRIPKAPPLLRRSPPPAPAPKRAAKEKVWKVTQSEAAAVLERRASEALRRARTKSLGATMAYPGLALTLPETPEAKTAARAESPEEMVLQEALARTGKAVAMPGIPTGKELLAEPGIAGERKPFALASETARLLMEEELARRPSTSTLPAKTKTRIEGPAARRQILYRPSPPKVTVERETAVLLKFWVRPDGTVGRVIPLRKGDPRLEVVAVRFLKGWRFNPLSAKAGEQWGTIPIVFRRP